MRITNQGLLSGILLGLQRNITRLEDYQSRIASGKRVLVPSDDPAATVKILDLRTAMVEAAQFRDNAEDGSEWLEQSDNVLSVLEETMVRIRELAVASANGTNSTGSYQAMAAELGQIIQSVADLGNTRVGELYIFSGQQVNTQPITLQATPPYATYAGDANAMTRGIAPGVEVPININAQEMLIGAANDGLLPTLSQLKDALDKLALDANDASALQTIRGDTSLGIPSILELIGKAENELVRLHTDVGARTKRLDAAIARAEAMEDGLSKLISKQEDLDVPRAILELATADASYKLSLQMGARIVQPTLMDFLK